MKEILLTTDFSDYALNAIFTAIKLQDGNKCNFILLHVYEPDARNITSKQNEKGSGAIYDAMHQNTLKKLEKVLNILTKDINKKQHTFSIKAIPGSLHSAINELIPKHDLDLIVMGTKGATRAKQIFLGSNTVSILKKIKYCPILVVPRKFNFQTLKRVVFPTQYANFFSKGQLNPLLFLTQAWDSKVFIFHVAQEFRLSEQQKGNKNILKERLNLIDYSFYKMTIRTTVAEAITDFAEEQMADMICLVNYKHTFMEKLTQEPVVKKIGFQTKVPLLVLPE